MAYELSSSTQAAVASAGRGRRLALEVQTRVGDALAETVNRLEDVGDHGAELARHATRGSAHVGDDLAGQLERVAHGSVLGALESGNDPAVVASGAVAAAREAASELGIGADEAAAAAAAGVEALDAVRASLPAALGDIEPTSPGASV